MEYQDVYVLAGLYQDSDQAKSDWSALGELHKQEMIGSYQAALFEKRADGKVKVIDTTSTTRSKGAGWGAAIGAAVGLVFPPALLATAAEGAIIGAAAGDLSKGWFRGDVKRLGDQLEPGQEGIIAVAEAGATLDEAMVLAHAMKTENEHVTGDDATKMKSQLESDKMAKSGQ
jgi:uncharacterized membrane protein